jgi:hypothetical protein
MILPHPCPLPLGEGELLSDHLKADDYWFLFKAVDCWLSRNVPVELTEHE